MDHQKQKVIEKLPKNTQGTKSSKLSQAQEDKRAEIKLRNSQQEFLAQAPLDGDQTPRFVTCVSHDVYNGNMKEYTWDQEKIFVHESLHDDLLMLQNVFEGKIISALVYPLVFDHKSPQREVSLRSIQFFNDVQHDNSLYYNLSPTEKGYFLIGVRDLFIAACRGLLSQEEKEILTNIVDLIDPNDSSIIYKIIDHIEVAPYPTASHKMVRFFEAESREDYNLLDECFVRNELGLLIGFVDPRDLSFHNFENIINLDSLFKVEEDYSVQNFKKHRNNEIYTFDLTDKNNTLLVLDKCGLYVQPLNKMSRGGERFIFASTILGDNLTNSLKKYVSNKTVMNTQFRFVNYIFRYNKFKPGDKKFTSHLDTPYHDPARKHYSKYTLILYLTPGTADPILSINNGKLKIDQIANDGYVKGVIFDQKYEHEGRSFIDSDKIFLRSELIYEYGNPYPDFKFNAEISRKFNIACYMTKQSVFDPELERYASDCFNQVAQARIDLAKADLTKDVLIYKKYRGVPFITNGYDYWFLKTISLKKAAIMTLLDYVGGKIADFHLKEEEEDSDDENEDNHIVSPNDLKFDERCDNLGELKDVKDIFEYLKDFANMKEKAENRNIEEEEKEKEEEEEEEEEEGEDEDGDDLVGSLSWRIPFDYDRDKIRDWCRRYTDEDQDEDEDEDENKKKNKRECTICKDGIIHPDDYEIDEALERCYSDIEEDLRKFKDECTVIIFDKEIKIEKSKMKINKDTIIFNEEIPTVHFAGCLYELCVSEFCYEKEINLTGYTNIPPIPYVVHPEGYHLKIELFNNGFVRGEQKTLETWVPRF